ncbi:hypothetical protein GOP47_0009970 [Adiantum capillus-veneris]|uniref:Uncharacterized protein n=1 Tax=Adiantum capillus-veneris TaxID=13818 RepID=A0A9D4ZHQ9_ADICA|nr:hypothetical protein GOP47_0009970 [Adiantum capillus-veneris]
MDMETPLNAGRLSPINPIASEDFKSMASVPQLASVVSLADEVSLQNLNGSSKEIPATHEPIVVQEEAAEGDSMAQSCYSPRNLNGEEAVGGVRETLADSLEVHKMESSDGEPYHAHETPRHEELLAVDSWSAPPLCEEHVPSFNDTASSAEPMIQIAHVPSGEPRGELSSILAEEGARENSSMDWAVAEEPASTYVSMVGEDGILQNANPMQAEDVVTGTINATLNETAKEGLTLVSHNVDSQNQVGGATPLPDPVDVVGPSPVIKEEEPSAASICAIDPVTVVGSSSGIKEEEPDSVTVVGPSLGINEEGPSAVSIPAVDLFESVSIRELQNMLMDSSLNRPEIASALHKVGVERVEPDCEIAVATLNEDSLNPGMGKEPDEQGLASGVAAQQMDCFSLDASQKVEKNTAANDSVCEDLASNKGLGVVDQQNIASESRIPADYGIEELQEAEDKRETEWEGASKDDSSASVKVEGETDEIMDIDKHIQDLDMTFEGGPNNDVSNNENNDVQMDSEVVPADDVFQEPQQFRKRGRKPGKKLVKNVEKDATAGLLQESEPEKETADSPLKSPMDEQKRELRKRGRKPAAAKVVQKEEEDVCFVCFDGGKLILCDKRSCPKAYHVECTGRESEFFEKKGQWFCGWHVCSQCSKSANLNCYMCPSALCNTCIKGANFLSIRKSRGLCEGCYPIVHMIEYNETVKRDPVQVDFNDKETYEGLFKEYWEELKLKHSLSSADFKNACKAREAGGISGEGEINDDEGGMNIEAEEIMEDENGGSTDSEDRPPMVRQSRSIKRKRFTRQSVAEDLSASEFEEDESDDEVKLESTPKKGRMKAPEFDGWASKELGDLIRSLKEDPKKQLPLFGVKKLLWRYIDDNKLTNPRRRGQILCDERLRKLFGKKQVGRFEMMKLIGLHVASPNKLLVSKGGESQYNDNDAVELDDIEENQLGKKKVRRKGDDKRLKADPSEYAAINVKNVNLIYLKRSVLDELRNDPELESKAMGAFVRIRVPGTTNKSDACYRLVQVIGVKQIYDALDPEKVTDVILEIMNLHKREEITADLVSNQELVEEECRRLRQSVRCGLIKPMRVGELEERARALREAKVKDWREFELLRLSHLRDRASEKGRKKELRECVEKLQLLSTPEEKERLLNAPFDIDADPFMDPDYESDEEDLPAEDVPVEMNAPQSTQEKFLPTTRFSEKGNSAEKLYNHRDSGGVLESHKSLHDTQQKTFSWAQKDPGNGVNGRQTADLQTQGWNSLPDMPNDINTLPGQIKAGWGDGGRVRDQATGWNQGSFGRKEVRWTSNSGGNVQNSGGGGWRRSENVEMTPRFPVHQADVPAERASGPVFSPIQTPTPAMPVAPLVSGANTGTMVIDSEKEKVWCYLDPTRTVQGPFTMEQLRKWEKTNLFPLDLRIWRVNESQDVAVLLSDVLAGRFASRGLVGPSHLLPGSAQGTHVNGIPVQGLNANNVSIGQNGGGVVPSGSAQGILSGPVPPPQRPVIQSFQSSVQGRHVHTFTPGPMQGPNAQGFSSTASVHAPNIHGFPGVPTQGANVRAFAPPPTQGPYVNNFSAAPLQGTPIQGPGYPPNVAQGVNVVPGQVQAPMVMQGRPQGPSMTLGQMQGPNVHPGHAQAPNVMHGSHVGNAPLGHPRGPHTNHFPMGAATGAVHNNAPQMGQVVSSDFRNATLPNRHMNDWQDTGRRSGSDQQFGGPPPSNMMEAAHEGGARVIPTRGSWRQGGPGASRHDNRDAHNRGQFGRSQNFRGSDHFQGSDGRFLPKKDLFCKYYSRGLCKKGQACDFRHE